MPTATRLALTLGFIGILVILAGADYALTHDRIALPEQHPTETLIGSEEEEATSSAPGAVTPEDGVDIEGTLQSLGFIVKNSSEDSVLREIIPGDRPVEMRVLLSGDDRVAFVAWTESDDVKTYFTALKEALQSSFSPQVTSLVDRTDERTDKPVRNILGFTDPGIHEERMVFVRVRQRLFEFHVSAGREGQIDTVIEALTE